MSRLPAIDQLEQIRQGEQSRLDGGRTQAERNRLGQFATPPELARAIARLARAHWASGERVRFLDPGVGTGAFYAALRSEFARREIEDARGLEVDEAVASVARRLWGAEGLEVHVDDFTRLRAPREGARANLILANPPYVRHHHLAAEDKLRLQARVASDLGLRISGLAGLYCYFLLLCDRWLKSDGLAAWLIPSEFFDVNYGRTVREYLTRRVTLLRVHRFDASDVQFNDALVSSVVLLFRKTQPTPDHQAILTTGGSLDEPREQRSVPLAELAVSARWTAFLNGHEGRLSSGPRLGDFFTIKRGIATGANGFFILPRVRARELNLPERFLRPILPSPRHLRHSVVETLADGYPDLAESLALIDCRVPERDVKKSAPSLHAYFQRGVKDGLLGRYLLSKREPWYQQEQRPPAPFLCTYMGRGAGKVKPFRFIWNKSRATAPNVYLMLFPTGALKEALRVRPGIAADVFTFLNSIDAEILRSGGRVYGGALHKVEPGELAGIPAGALGELIGTESPVASQLSLFQIHSPVSRKRVARTA
jgi:adenine-specific DNA-methyltransferase